MADIARYTTSHKGWDHVGNLTPLFEHSESIRPHFPGKSAPWLPVSAGATNVSMGFISRFDVRDEDYVVVSSGKVVAVDRLGGVCPAGVRLTWAAAAGGDDILVYDATDVSRRVIDLGTGEFVSAAKTYTKTTLLAQLRQMGYLAADANLETFIGHGVGLASYNYWKSAGPDLDNPSTWSYHNYKMQDLTAILCDYTIRLPLIPRSHSGETVGAFVDAFAATTDLVGAAAVWGTLTSAQTVMDRYDDETNTNVVALLLGVQACAKHTTRTPVTIETAGAVVKTSDVLIRERTAVDNLNTAGDWFLDHTVGILWFYESGGNALPTGLGATDVVRFYDYNAVPGAVSTYAAVVGDVYPGDFLMYDENSNLTVFSETDFAASDVTVAGAGNPSDAELATIMDQVMSAIFSDTRKVMGQVLGFQRHPQDALDRVKTAYSFLGTQDQMPGSASGGYPDTITYASGSDTEVIINLIGR